MAGESGNNDSAPPGTESPGAGRWSSLSARTKRIFLIIAIVALVLLAALVTLILVLTLGGRCSLSSGAPSLGKPRAVYSLPDVSNLVKFSGYINIYERGFLALDIKRMILSKSSQSITLEDDCVHLKFNYGESSDKAYVTISDLQWMFTSASGRSREPYERCDLSLPEFHHTFPVPQHYSCLERQSHQCRVSNREGQYYAVAELVVQSLELELDGDTELIYRGEFSKPSYYNSCNTYANSTAPSS